jgi:hypothetical protein
MFIPRVGTKLRHIPTGIIYEVKKITRQFVILYSTDGSRQILAEIKSLPSRFEPEEVSHGEPAQDNAA